MDPLIDPILQPLMEMGSTGVLVAMILTGFKLFENRTSKQGRQDSKIRVAVLEERISDLADKLDSHAEKLDTFHSDFQTFREEVRLSWAKTEAREDAIRELRSAP